MRLYSDSFVDDFDCIICVCCHFKAPLPRDNTHRFMFGLSGEAVFSLSTCPTLSQTPVGSKVTTLGLV